MEHSSLNLFGIDFSFDNEGLTWFGDQTNNEVWKFNASTYLRCFPWVTNQADYTGIIKIYLERFDQQLRPAESQEEALKFFLDHSEDILKSILSALLEEYEAIYECLELKDDDSEPKPIDVKEDVSLVSDRIFLSSIAIHENSRKGVSYTTLYFQCPWDVEHGLEIVMYQARVVSTGGAWEAIEDDIKRGPVRHYFGEDSW